MPKILSDYFKQSDNIGVKRWFTGYHKRKHDYLPISDYVFASENIILLISFTTQYFIHIIRVPFFSQGNED